MTVENQINDWLYYFVQQYRRRRAAAWMLNLLFASVILLIAAASLDRLFAFNSLSRWIAFGVVLLPMAIFFIIAITSLVHWPFDRLSYSRQAERKYPELEGRLSTWFTQQQYPAGRRGNEQLLDLLAMQVSEIISRISWKRVQGRTINRRLYWQMFLSLLAMGGLLFVPDFGLPQVAARLLSPWKSIKPVTTTQVQVVTGSIQVRQGSSIAIVADLIKPRGPVYLIMNTTPNESVQIEMQPTSPDRYAVTIPSILRPADYYIRCGNAQSDRFHIGIDFLNN